jgi:NADPH:quinone reductase
MRALQLREAIGPDGLEVVELPDPVPGDGMVLVEVHAAGVGFVDMLMTRGEYQIQPPLPYVPGTEVAGVVVAGGSLAPGTRVAATTPLGGFADLALAPEQLVFPIPDELAFDAAAGFVVNYQTAHLALTRCGRLAPGEAVLVHGAGGGVGTAAIDVAKALGAGLVVGVARGADRRAAAFAAGADLVVDPDDDWKAEVLARTGAGADVVVDPVGGDAFHESLRCTAPGGRILVVGFASGTIPEVKVNRLLLRQQAVVGVNYGAAVARDPAFAAAAATEMCDWIRAGRLRPVVGRTYDLADGGAALQAFADRTVTGKPVLLTR